MATQIIGAGKILILNGPASLTGLSPNLDGSAEFAYNAQDKIMEVWDRQTHTWIKLPSNYTESREVQVIPDAASFAPLVFDADSTILEIMEEAAFDLQGLSRTGGSVDGDRITIKIMHPMGKAKMKHDVLVSNQLFLENSIGFDLNEYGVATFEYSASLGAWMIFSLNVK